MPDVDLDALRRARAEALGIKPTLTSGGKKFALKPELTVVGALAAARARVGDTSYKNVRDFLTEALADAKDVDRVLASGFVHDDVVDALAAWSQDPGESPASPPSSKAGGAPSKRTSPPPTKSTSRKRSGKTP